MNQKKIFLYIALSFGISWLTALLAWLADIKMGGLVGTLVLGGLFMWGPALAVIIIQKLIYKENLSAYGLTVKNFDYRYFLASVAAPAVAFLLYLGVETIMGNIAGIPGFGNVSITSAGMEENVLALVEGQGETIQQKAVAQVNAMPAWAFLIYTLVIGMIAGTTFNLLFTFGEEFGWRGLLLTELKSMGFWKSNLLIGMIWGLWHAPLIIQGHNYPGHPWAGAGMMVLFCIAASFPMAYLGEKTGSILGASAFHGVINAVAGGSIVFVAQSNPLLGGIAGVAGILSFLLLTVAIVLWDPEYIRNFGQKEKEMPISTYSE